MSRGVRCIKALTNGLLPWRRSRLGLALLAFRFAGFLGVGLLGVLIGIAAFNYDLRKSDIGGGAPSPSLYAKQVAREQ